MSPSSKTCRCPINLGSGAFFCFKHVASSTPLSSLLNSTVAIAEIRLLSQSARPKAKQNPGKNEGYWRHYTFERPLELASERGWNARHIIPSAPETTMARGQPTRIFKCDVEEQVLLSQVSYAHILNRMGLFLILRLFPHQEVQFHK
jgi:hypothetical protein